MKVHPGCARDLSGAVPNFNEQSQCKQELTCNGRWAQRVARSRDPDRVTAQSFLPVSSRHLRRHRQANETSTCARPCRQAVRMPQPPSIDPARTLRTANRPRARLELAAMLKFNAKPFLRHCLSAKGIPGHSLMGCRGTAPPANREQCRGGARPLPFRIDTWSGRVEQEV